MADSRLMHLIFSTLLVIAIIAIPSSTSSVAHFAEANQGNGGDDNAANLADYGLTPLQLDMLAQRLADYNQVPPIPAAWERLVRLPSINKRQSRYRQCYFNPVSCFKK